MISPTLAAQIAALPLPVTEDEFAILEIAYEWQSVSARFILEHGSDAIRMKKAGLLKPVRYLGVVIGYELTPVAKQIVTEIMHQDKGHASHA
jgi:hypothetical protein